MLCCIHDTILKLIQLNLTKNLKILSKCYLFSINICIFSLQFWTALQKELEKVDESERCIVIGDMNGHIGNGNDAISRIHGVKAYGDGNEDGERIIDLALSFDLMIGNAIFCKKNEHLIT